VSDQDRNETRRGAPPGVWATRLSDVWDVGVVVLSPAGDVDFANARARTLLNVADDADFGGRWRDAARQLDSALRGAVAGQPAPVEATVSVGGEDAETRRLRAQVFVVEEDDCVAHLVLLQHADRAAAIEASLRHASQNRGLASLYQDLAHDLKSVLNVIGLNLALLSRATSADGGSPADLQRAVHCGDVMRRELRRLDHAIDLILDRSLVERDVPETFDLGACCERVARLSAARAARQRVEVRVDLPAHPVSVTGFTDRVQGALLNLVVNALDAMPDGGTLELRAWQDAGTTHLRVADTGPGIPDEAVPLLWKLHHTTKPAGTGIGLHVARATVESHGGTIAYHRNDGGNGASFTMAFPGANERR
jgi:two-component system sensor histidine kinase HydH